MSDAVRIQRRRGVAGWKMPPNTVYVGRPTKWGNPMPVGTFRGFTAADAVESFRGWIERRPTHVTIDGYARRAPPTLAEVRRELRGKNLCCWCKPGEPCHADVLLEIANTPEGQP